MTPERQDLGPLHGLVVTDLSRVLSGPLAGMLLGDLGAQVIKVERPGTGDDTRHWGPPFLETATGRESTYFLAVNRNKQSIELDFAKPSDREVLHGLIRKSDVIIENFRPRVLRNLGLSPEEMLELNPGLIVLSISGFGTRGVAEDRPGYDQIIQGEAGLMSLTGMPGGPPLKAGVPIADIQAGMFGVIGVLAALHERRQTGRGQVVRTSLFSALVASHTFQATRWLLGGEVPTATGNMHPTVAPYGAFTCADGDIQLAVGNDAAWQRFCSVVGMDPTDERFATNQNRIAHRAVLDAMIADILSTDQRDTWVRRLDEAGIPSGRIQTLDEVYDSEFVRDGNLLLEVEHPELGALRLPGLPYELSKHRLGEHMPPPLLGQHSDEIRRWVLGGREERPLEGQGAG
jgi:crotonobetainyl-CoA:carnitine CoA-transferase CaiB-like acyl-CoA transferase